MAVIQGGKGPPVVASATPANPSTTTSTAGVMMGLGSSCTITPTTSRVQFSFYGIYFNSAASNCTFTLKFGTGAAPANGAAATGTTVGVAQTYFPAALSTTLPFAAAGNIITGLIPGTAYWFDVQFGVAASGTAGLQNLVFNAIEV